MLKQKKFSASSIAFVSLLCLVCFLNPTAEAQNSSCHFEALLTPVQRQFNTRVLNLMARHESGSRGEKSSPRGKKASNFEDAILAAYEYSGKNPKQAAADLAKLLDVPPEVAEVAIAFYDLEDRYRNSPELRANLKQQINEFFPLPDAHQRVPVDGRTIKDSWSDGLQRHSPAKRQFTRWKAGGANSMSRNAGDDDGMWWKDIIMPIKAIDASQAKVATPELGEFLSQESGRLWQLYGALVERSLIKSQSGEILPGSALAVGGKKHADAWKVQYDRSGDSPRFIIEGLFESKASFLGVIRAQDQIRGFLTRLTENPNRIFVLGEWVDPRIIYLKTREGSISLSDFARQHSDWVKGETVDTDFAEKFKKLFLEDFYQVALPKGEPQPPIPVGKFAETTATRAELQNQFAALVHKRFRPKEEDPHLLTQQLFSEAGKSYTLPSEWAHYRNFRRTHQVRRIVSIDEWMDPETGAIAAIRSLPYHSAKIGEALDAMSAHLPHETSAHLSRNFPVAGFDFASASSTNKPNRAAADRLRGRLEALISEHNTWAAESPSTRTAVPAENLVTKAGMEKAIELILAHSKQAQLSLQRASQVIPIVDFIDPSSGGILALKKLPRHSNGIDESLNELAAHLQQETVTRLEQNFPVSPKDLAAATATSRPTRPSAERLRSRLEALITAHNNWVAESPLTRTAIPAQNLATKSGMEKAVDILQSFSKQAQLSLQRTSQPIPLDDFSNLSFGGVLALKNLPGYSYRIDESLREQAAHLSNETIAKLAQNFPVKPSDGVNATYAAQPNRASAERVRKHLQALITEHNTWAAESPSTRTAIPTENLATKLGMEKAIEILLTHAREAQLSSQRTSQLIPFDDFIDSSNGGILSLKSLTGYSRTIDQSLAKLDAHLPQETIARLDQNFPVAAKDLGSATGAERVRSRLEALITEHNAWAAELPDTRKAIPTQNLSTKLGMEKAIEILQAHSQEAQRSLQRVSQLIPFDDFIDPSHGGILALKSLPGNSYRIDESLGGLASHLPTETADRLTQKFPVAGEDLRQAIKTSKPYRTSAERIWNRLQALVRAHNTWVAESPHARTAIPTENIATKSGIEKAIGILQTYSREAQLSLQRASQLIPFEDFFDLSSGGILALKGFPGYSYRIDESLGDMAKHLPEETIARLAKNFPVAGKDVLDATNTTKHNRTSAERVRNRLEALITAHNTWVAESPSTRRVVPIEALATRSGMEKAIEILQSHSEPAHLIPLTLFSDRVQGGIAALNNLPGYSTRVDESLDALATHLSNDTVALLAQNFPVAGRDVADATYNNRHSLPAVERVRNRLQSLINAHNTWAAESPNSRKSIPTANLATRAGMLEAIRILQNASKN